MRVRRHQATQRRNDRAGVPTRWVKAGFALLATIALMGGGVLAAQRLVDPETFPVRAIKVKGEFRFLVREKLQQAVEPHLENGLLRVNVDVVRGAVEALPWVMGAQVRRVWPEGLEVTVVEQQPLARWGEGGLVNRQGDRFAAAPGTGPGGLPLLSGPSGSSRLVTQRYREFSVRLADAGLALTHLELDPRNAWRIKQQGGLVIDLGRDDVDRRLERFTRLYKKVLAKDPRRVERVDLRYANGFAVQFTKAGEETPKDDGKRQGALKGELANAKKA